MNGLTNHSTATATAGSTSNTTGPLTAKDQAKRLQDATKAGQLGKAYGMLQGLDPREVTQIMLYAGFAVIGTHCREFWADVQGQIARASAMRVDGYGLRGAA